jgi:diacylglycerol kinase (ATP)
MERLVSAFGNSARALKTTARNEAAVKQELIVIAIAVPVAAWLASTALQFVVLVGALVFVLIVEVLNTGIEKACDAVSPDFDANIRIAKDCGSLAVLLSILLAASVWLVFAADVLFP